MKQSCVLAGLIISALLVSIVSSTVVNTPTCLDDDGKPVDWYIAYKFPYMKGYQKPFNSGFAYAYITSEDLKAVDPLTEILRTDTDVESVTFLNKFKNFLLQCLGLSDGYKKRNRKGKKINSNEPNWTISEKLLLQPDSLVQRTLAIAYAETNKSSNKLNSILYNDQPPVAPSNRPQITNNKSRAHAKGVVLIDDESGDGVWLTHSAPQYPPYTEEKLKFGKNIARYGQTFMCISFDVKRSGKQIVEHLVTMFPQVYQSNISSKLEDMIPELEYLTLEQEKKRNKNSTVKLAQVITTRAGQDMYLYSKSSKFGEDLYSNWISKEVESSLYVETWRLGQGNILDSWCPRNDYHTNNIEDMQLEVGNQKITWPYSLDHSKWAITSDKDSGFVCIADINRNKSQFSRGGGAACIKNQKVWEVFSKTIQDLEPCPKGIVKSKESHDETVSVKESDESIEELVEKLGELSMYLR